jgi:hypothetical protein
MATKQTKVVNLFANATSVVAEKPALGSNNPTLPLAGILDLAEVDAVIKSLEAVRATIETEVKAKARTQFITAGVTAHKHAGNFTGTEGVASAAVQLKKKSSASALGEAAVTLATEFDISTKEVLDRPEHFFFNPDYTSDATKQTAISSALAPLIKNGTLPADIIQFQEATKKVVVTDQSLDEVFKVAAIRKLTAEKVGELLDVFSTAALAPKYTAPVTKALFARVVDMVFNRTERAKAAAVQNLMAQLKASVAKGA